MSELIPIEREGLRVLLTSQLAEAYETTTDTITKNFNRNKERYQEGKHFFVLEGETKHEFLNHLEIQDGLNLGQFVPGLKNAAKLYLWTEKGALLHAKSLNTDKAWEVYDHLAETYFRAKQVAADLSQLSPQLQILIGLEMEQKRQAAALQAVEQKLQTADQKMNNIRDVILLDSRNWRENCDELLKRIAKIRGVPSQVVRQECFDLIDRRGGVSLFTRLMHERERIEIRSRLHNTPLFHITEVDIIAKDKKLIAIYLAIVKEMAVKYGAA